MLEPSTPMLPTLRTIPEEDAVARIVLTVLQGVTSPHTQRSYALALGELLHLVRERCQPLSRELILTYRASMIERKLAASTINVRLSAVRKLIEEARRMGALGMQDAAELADFSNIRQQGQRMGNWLTHEQSRELLRVPDLATLKGKRDSAILALLLGCALRRAELATLRLEQIQIRDNRWVIPDMPGKGGRIRTVAVPRWVKEAVDVWTLAAGILSGSIARSVTKGGMVGANLSTWSIWNIVQSSAREIGIEQFGAHDLRRTCAKLCRRAGGELEQIRFLLGHASIATTERYIGAEQDLAIAVNDNLGL
jgi:integrase